MLQLSQGISEVEDLADLSTLSIQWTVSKVGGIESGVGAIEGGIGAIEWTAKS